MNTPRKKTWLINCTADEDRAKQSFKDECDMNRIVGRISKTGFIPLEAQDSLRRQVFADASAAPQSLEDAYAIVERADQAFNSLPARLRERFGGPSGLLEFLMTRRTSKRLRTSGWWRKRLLPPLAAQIRPLLRLLSTERAGLRSSQRPRRYRNRGRPSRPKACRSLQ